VLRLIELVEIPLVEIPAGLDKLDHPAGHVPDLRGYDARPARDSSPPTHRP
jgi:hypothetical protein